MDPKKRQSDSLQLVQNAITADVFVAVSLMDLRDHELDQVLHDTHLPTETRELAAMLLELESNGLVSEQFDFMGENSTSLVGILPTRIRFQES